MSKAIHLCPTKYCRRRRRAKGTHCSRCSMRMWRAENPIAALLGNIRSRAGRKKLEFSITLEWFSQFLLDNHYDRCLHHIDRISAGKGYVMGNLQVLPIADNIAKGNRERWGQFHLL